PEIVVDAKDLRLVHVAVQLLRERPCRLEVVTERLLDDDPRIAGHAGLREAAHDLAEEERRDLEVEDRQLHAVELLRDRRVRARVVEVSYQVREAAHEAGEDVLVELLAG